MLTSQFVRAALIVLAVLQTLMLVSMFAGVPPHPPRTTPLFAMGPFLSASISIAVAGAFLAGSPGRLSSFVSMLAALLALVSYGPQKWTDPAIAQIWPAVLLGQLAAVLIIAAVFVSRRHAFRRSPS